MCEAQTKTQKSLWTTEKECASALAVQGETAIDTNGERPKCAKKRLLCAQDGGTYNLLDRDAIPIG